jgi:hypothetical protein
MDKGEFVLLLSRLSVAAAASFLAIILWSRTRDPAWMLMVVGTIALYADIVYSLLTLFGAVDPAALAVAGVPVAPLVFTNLPPLFYAIAFAVMIVRKRNK